ncbi:Manganese-dependent protein-tyrosine phosphatase [Caldibacillus thermoamylovorans]|uniref:tyrosine-protein phosphatase n=1 Tax=Caldibacillus thermoamylovorans TaxID=35841 RepID=UPI0005A487CA|nr:CpsB/CapC family capsule biosynthesis tyrosine phosphatase [Caldibacillus thermoamylovorans]KIO68272.1 Manganese-dependent protein-tyrosine phosphatase [Caldibacillus thermoamylovorans]
MIDIHCHILPGLDDGAQNLNDSLDMARAAVSNGIHKVVATPHHKTSRYNNPKSAIVEKVNELNELLQENQVPLEVLLGQGVRVFGDFVEDFKNEQILTVNLQNYVLVELPSNHVPSYTEQLFYDIQMNGLTPIIVHPERNSQIVEQPDKLYNLIEKGALSQVTASSVTGELGKKIQRFTFQLIDANLTHFIATDAHNITSRPFNLAEAYDVVEKEYGIEFVDMFMENAEHIIGGKMIYRENPERIKRKKILGIF